MLEMLLPFIIGLVVIGGFVALGPFYLVREQSVAIIERFGRYHKTSKAGVHLRIPLGVDNIAARIQLRMLQSENVVEPDAEVKQAMNEINAAQRKRVVTNSNQDSTQ